MKKSCSLVLSVAMLVGCFSMGATGVATADAESENRYAAVNGGVIHETVYDTVYYARRDITETYINPYKLPEYFADNIANSCAITAGGDIIGNFDRTYEELIPNHTTFFFMGQYSYGSHDDAVDAMHRELYQRMGSTSAGTTVAGYKTGMTSYVQSKGRNIEITSIYNNSSLNESAYRSALESGKLLTVFLDGFAIVGLAGVHTYDGYDKIGNTVVTGLHTVAAYGYVNVKYYDASDNLIQEDKYIYVNTGFASAGLGMIRLNKYTSVDDGYAINIT